MPPLDDHLRIADDTQALDLYWVPNNGHMADVLVGYIASERLLMEGDLVTAAFDSGIGPMVSATSWRGTSSRSSACRPCMPSDSSKASPR